MHWHAVVLQVHTHPPRVSRNSGVRSLSPLGVGSSASICAIAAAALMSASCAYGKNTLCPCSPVGSVLPGASAMRARLHVELPQPHCNRPRCMSNFGSHAPVLFLDRTNSPLRRPPGQHVQTNAHSIACTRWPRCSAPVDALLRTSVRVDHHRTVPAGSTRSSSSSVAVRRFRTTRQGAFLLHPEGRVPPAARNDAKALCASLGGILRLRPVPLATRLPRDHQILVLRGW